MPDLEIILYTGDDLGFEFHPEGTQGPQGIQGDQGDQGIQGIQGTTGAGVPTGGTADQVLAKIDGTDYNTQWVTNTAGAAAWGGITGTLSAQTDLQSALDAKAIASRTVNGHSLTADVTVTKSDISLGNVDNTSDANKPVSAAQAAADAAVLSSAQAYADALTTADVADSSNKRYVTDAQLAVIGNTSGTNTGDQLNITGNAATVTTNANLTGPITSVGNATSVTSRSITNAMLATPLTCAEVEIDFGSTPVDEGSVTVTGQSEILTTSTVDAVIMAKATSNNTVIDAEFAAAAIRLSPSEPSAGVGFTIKAFCILGLVSGKFKINYRWA